jgi:hypothetical protein
MPHGPQRDHRKEQFWRDALARWRDSGLTIRRCRRSRHLGLSPVFGHKLILFSRRPHHSRLSLGPLEHVGQVWRHHTSARPSW